MGWANCGTDSTGRQIGYAHGATCDHEGCSERIDRGLAYVCGDMHGTDEVSCEKYFCHDHRQNYVLHDDRTLRVCDACAKALLESEDFTMNEDEGAIVYQPNSKIADA